VRVRGGGRRGGCVHLEAVLRRGDIVGGRLERDLKATDVSACRALGRVQRRASWLLRGGLRVRGEAWLLHRGQAPRLRRDVVLEEAEE
jgi:hypothetical protein